MEARPAMLLLLCPNVTLLEIKGTQRTPLDTGDLQVITMETSPEDKASIAAQLGMDPGLVPKEIAFASCGTHRIPLNKSYPCLAMEERLFVFALPGMMLGLQIAPDADGEELDVLNGILTEHCNFRRKEVKVTSRHIPVTAEQPVPVAVEPKAPLGDRIADGVLTVGAFAVKGLKVGTEALSNAITAGSDKYVECRAPKEQPVEVSSTTMAQLNTTRMLTRSAVTISATMAQTAVGVTMLLADQVANHVSHTPGASKLADPRLAGVKKVGLAAIGVAAEVLLSVTAATKTILTCSADATSKMVEHRYGAQAGEATRQGLGIVGDGIEIGINAESMGTKSVLKKVAAQSARKVIADSSQEKSNLPPPPPPMK